MHVLRVSRHFSLFREITTKLRWPDRKAHPQSSWYPQPMDLSDLVLYGVQSVTNIAFHPARITDPRSVTTSVKLDSTSIIYRTPVSTSSLAVFSGAIRAESLYRVAQKSDTFCERISIW
jgi:hypothetical protein